jgi:hypothetical protein
MRSDLNSNKSSLVMISTDIGNMFYMIDSISNRINPETGQAILLDDDTNVNRKGRDIMTIGFVWSCAVGEQGFVTLFISSSE